MKTLFLAFLLLFIATVQSKPADANDDYDYADVQNDDENEDDDYGVDEPEGNSNDNEGKNLDIQNQGEVFIRNVGETVYLPCIIIGEDPVQVWKKDAQVLYQANVMMGAKPNMKIWSNGTLEINHLELNNSGVYECTAMYDENIKKSIQHTVQIYHEPSIGNILINDGSNNVLKTGDRLKLTCPAKGYPVPQVSWHKNAERLAAVGETLTIENVKHHHEGIYRCLADNKVGSPAHSQVKIKIEYKPLVSLEKYSVNSDTNMSIELKCMAHGEPWPSVGWKKDGRNIVPSDRIQLSKPVHGEKAHTLRINQLEESDFANYSCSAVNYMGSTVKTVSLVRTPAILKFIKPKKESKDVVLAWEVESKTPISQHELGYRKQGENEWKVVAPEVEEAADDGLYQVKYTLNGLEPGVYETRIRSENGNGWSDYSEIMPFEGVYAKSGHQHKPKKNPKDKHTTTTTTIQEATTIKNVVPPAEHNEYDTVDTKSSLASASETGGSASSSPAALLVSIALFYCLAVRL